MAEDTKIEWCHATFNPWRGCTKVSEGCKFCYAETLSKRNPKVLGVWGPKGTRAPAAESYWREPLRWNKEAKAAGERRRVFCASLADVFEGPETCQEEDAYRVVQEGRERLWSTIYLTPNLDWLLLTKRPENVRRFTQPYGWDSIDNPGAWPANVWIGTSVEDQAAADKRIPELLRVPAPVRFLSCEPLLGPVNLEEVTTRDGWQCDPLRMRINQDFHQPVYAINWVIAGGESGPNARPMHPDWARSLRDQCQAAGVPFHFKQFGQWAPSDTFHPHWLADKQVCLWPDGDYNTVDPAAFADRYTTMPVIMHSVGKKEAGRLLDGRTWDGFPEVARG